MIQVAVVCLSFIGVLILLYLFLGRPILRYAARMKSEFRLKQTELYESDALIRNFPNPQKAIEDIEKKTQELKDMGVTRKQIPRIIQLLGDSINKLNINVISVRPRDDIKRGDENLPAGVSRIYIEIVMSCPYQLIGEYVKSLSELPVAFFIENLLIEKKEEGFVVPAAKGVPEKAKDEPEELMTTLLLSTYTIWEL
jgi:Tfp pilus assembly protein PilO